MDEGTESASFFIAKAQDVLRHLHGFHNSEASSIRAQIADIIVIFERWATKAPENEERTRVVQKLFMLNCDALALTQESLSSAADKADDIS